MVINMESTWKALSMLIVFRLGSQKKKERTWKAFPDGHGTGTPY